MRYLYNHVYLGTTHKRCHLESAGTAFNKWMYVKMQCASLHHGVLAIQKNGALSLEAK